MNINSFLWLFVIFGSALTMTPANIKYDLNADDILVPVIGNMQQAHEHIKKLKEMAMVSGFKTRPLKPFKKTTKKYKIANHTEKKLNKAKEKHTKTDVNETSNATKQNNVGTTVHDIYDEKFIPFHLQSTIRPDILKYPNLTLYDLAERLKAIEVSKIVDKDFSIPNFGQDDDPATITRRFDEIKTNQQEKALRVDYYYYSYRFLWKNYRAEKVMFVQIMLQFIYMTRYKVEYAQKMRSKYIHTPTYKIGYLFGLIRQLQREQMILYSSYHRNQFIIWSLHYHIKLYEKVVRLDIDLKDVIALIRRYQYEKNSGFSDMYRDMEVW